MFFDEIMIPLAVIALIIFALLVGVNSLEDMSCEKAWEDSGMRSKYSWSTDCMVEIKKGTWIPARNYRDID